MQIANAWKTQIANAIFEAEGDIQMDRRVTLYALSTILRIVGA